jgi:hypothetical protein
VGSIWKCVHGTLLLAATETHTKRHLEFEATTYCTFRRLATA